MDRVVLKGRERIDDLLTQQLKIIQSDEVFSFSMDAVLLARFCLVPQRGTILDLCTGNGVIPLLLSTRTKAKIVGLEIQPKLYDMAVRSVAMNGLEKQLEMVCGDLRDYHKSAGYGKFDAITVNPPYLPAASGAHNPNVHQAMARHEINGTLEDVISACAKLVRTGGKVSMVHKPSRLAEIVTLMKHYKLEPKRMRFVHPRADQEANMVLIEAMRDGKPEIRLLPPLIVHEGDAYCNELAEIYEGRKNKLTLGEDRCDEGSEKF